MLCSTVAGRNTGLRKENVWSLLYWTDPAAKFLEKVQYML
jgi:hypothetical protein